MDEAKAKGVDSLRSPFLGSIPTKLMVRLAKIGLKEEIKISKGDNPIDHGQFIGLEHSLLQCGGSNLVI